MMAPLATCWVVVVEVAGEDPAETTLQAFGPFSGSDARERAGTFCAERCREEGVYSAAVLPMRRPLPPVDLTDDPPNPPPGWDHETLRYTE
jgi:hypothetical protein